MERFLTAKNRSLLVIIVALLATVFSFQNCSQPGSFTGSSKSNQYASPYAAQKVILNKNSFKSELKSANQQPVLNDNLTLILAINNACAASQCANPTNADTITCTHYSHEGHPTLKMSTQYYETSAPNANMSASDISAWVEATQTDQACIVGVSESHNYKISAMFNDTYYPNQQQNYSLINFEPSQSVWSASLATVKVGVIDTGIAVDPDLETNVVARYDFRSLADQTYTGCTQFSSLTQPNNGHGTFVAGIIGALRNNNLGIAGIAPNAKLTSFTVGNCNGTLTTSEVANAIQAAITQGMEVINLSIGSSDDDVAVRDAIVQGLNASIIFVAAAGNSSADLAASPSYPAAYSANYEGVIAVAASDPYGNVATFSNYSSTFVNIIAPGQSVASICLTGTGIVSVCQTLGGNYGTGNGTSFAAPMVTGAVALTLGTLKNQPSYAYSASGIENMVTIQGARAVSNLAAFVANGSFLDLNLLATAANGGLASTSGNEVTITSTSVTMTNGVPTLNVTFSWNVSNLPAGTQLGLFNISSGCNYTAPCLIQGLTFSGNSGSMTIQIPQDQLVMMMADPSDPTFKLPISIAFYYPIYNSTGSKKNNPGIAAQTTLDLRTINASNLVTNPQLLGAVTNVRMDMQYFYVQGWTCYQGSNAAAEVSIEQLPSQTPLSVRSVYNYKFMDINSKGGAVVDTDFQGNSVNPLLPNKPNTGAGSYPGTAVPPLARPYMASPITVYYTGQTQYLAGLENNPQLVSKCQGFTASQGFELIVPISQIAQSALSETSFQVVSTLAGHTTILADATGDTQFQFPDVNFQTSVSSSFTVNRTAPNLSLTGSLCTTSPSPVEAEISFSSFDYTYALFGCSSCGSGGGGGFVSDSSLSSLALQELDYSATSTPELTIKTSTVNPANIDPFTETYLSYPINPPNTTVNTGSFPSPINGALPSTFPPFLNLINAKSLTQIGTGLPVTFAYNDVQWTQGPQENSDLSTEIQARSTLAWVSAAASSLISLSTNGLTYSSYETYWDWYDVGSSFSTASGLIGYTFSTGKPTGAYLQNTYGVNQVIREVKKYETPLSSYDTVLGHGQLTLAGKCGNGTYQYGFSSPLVVANIANYAPLATNTTNGFFLNASSVINFSPTSVSPSAAMQRVPVTLRFFQDGKLILHLESDTASTFYPINYPFQTTSY